MRILLHCCCGPCTIYPLERLRAAGHQIHGYYQSWGQVLKYHFPTDTETKKIKKLIFQDLTPPIL